MEGDTWGIILQHLDSIREHKLESVLKRLRPGCFRDGAVVILTSLSASLSDMLFLQLAITPYLFTTRTSILLGTGAPFSSLLI